MAQSGISLALHTQNELLHLWRLEFDSNLSDLLIDLCTHLFMYLYLSVIGLTFSVSLMPKKSTPLLNAALNPKRVLCDFGKSPIGLRLVEPRVAPCKHSFISSSQYRKRERVGSGPVKKKKIDNLVIIFIYFFFLVFSYPYYENNENHNVQSSSTGKKYAKGTSSRFKDQYRS